MGARYGQPDRRKFDNSPMSNLVFMSANIIELAGFNEPEMAPNVRKTFSWQSQDIHQSVWRLEAIQDPDPALSEKYDGVSPVQYQLHRKTIGTHACFLYRSDMERLGTLSPNGMVNNLVSKEVQDLRIPELLDGLDAFPKDLAITQSPILQYWSSPDYLPSAVEYNSNVFDTIIARNYGYASDKISVDPKPRKSFLDTIRNWYGIDR